MNLILSSNSVIKSMAFKVKSKNAKRHKLKIIELKQKQSFFVKTVSSKSYAKFNQKLYGKSVTASQNYQIV